MSAHATQLDQLLPPALRPGPTRAMTTEVERLIDGGWNVTQIHAALMPTMGPTAGPGVVIYQLRHLPDEPPSNHDNRPRDTYSPHSPCPDEHTGMHGQPCELCWCDSDRGPVHHVRTDPWIGWPDLNLIPDDYGPGWLRNTAPPSPTTNAPW